MFADSTLLNRLPRPDPVGAGGSARAVLAAGGPAQTKTYCGPEVKDEVAKALAGVENALGCGKTGG